MMRRTLTAAIFLVCACCGLAATPSKREALQAIEVLEKSVSGPEATDAAKVIVVYAQLSDDVMVDIGPEQLPWVGEHWGIEKGREAACQSLLLAAFVAGNVKSQIKNDKAEDDTYSGWIFAIDTYRRLRTKESFRSPSMESLQKMQSDGTLLQHARDVHLKMEEDSQQGDAAQKPPA